MSDGMTDRRSQTHHVPDPHTGTWKPVDAKTVPAARPNVDHIKFLDEIAREDVRHVEVAERNYGSSWKKRGGVGAYMMLTRKSDRIENALRPSDDDDARANLKTEATVAPWDIFGAIAADARPEGIIDDIRDLRRYLLLVESEMRARGASSAQPR